MQRVQQMRERIASGATDLADFFVARREESIVAAVRLAGLGGGLYKLVGPVGDEAAAAELVGPAIVRACARNAIGMSARTRVDPSLAPYQQALIASGFTALGERLEFKTDVATLPNDEGTPIQWKTMGEVGRAEAARMYAAACAGDPHGLTPDDDPAAMLESYLADPELTHGDDCVAIGYLDDAPVAFVCAQVAPSDGWSRLTYMGIVQGARGKGLGTWVHRRGFTMMAAQGGKTYHGGTAAENAGMVKLFQRHGCEEIARLSEYEWRAPKPA